MVIIDVQDLAEKYIVVTIRYMSPIVRALAIKRCFRAHLNRSPHGVGRRVVKHDLLLRADVWLNGAAAARRRGVVDGHGRRRADHEGAR